METRKSGDCGDSAEGPILVLGLGNLLLSDDGVGLELLTRLRRRRGDLGGVSFLDGGTQGLALLPYLTEAWGLLILDAVQLGAAPGTVHVIDDAPGLAGRMASTAHEGNAADLLAAARLIGQCPAHVRVVGVEPAEVRTGVGLSDPVASAVDAATVAAEEALLHLIALSDAEATPCTN